MGVCEHFVQFYEDDAVLLTAVAGYIGAALRAGDAGVVIATPAHLDAVEQCLQADGCDPAAARASGQLVTLEASELLTRFLVDGTPDPERFVQTAGPIIAGAARGQRHVRVFGEMMAMLTAAGNASAAVRLEQLWNGLQQTQPCTLFCAYPMDGLGDPALAGAIGPIHAAHTAVVPAESYTALPTDDARRRAVAALQQKARWLEAEIAERQRAEERLARALAAERVARQAAEDALRQRDAFLSVAAHELKTPVTSLSGFAQLLLRRYARDARMDPERVAHALREISGQAAKLTRLLNQLLDISRLEAGKLALDCQPADLRALLEQAVAGAQARTDLHTFSLDGPAVLEAEIDPLRVEQVLTNLLDNAIKYSPHGGAIEVTLAATPHGAAEIAVRDHGLGIAPEQRARIFERFFQAHAKGFVSGLGLGLHISRQIVELHGGQIAVEFPPNGGTCMRVRLPISRHAVDFSHERDDSPASSLLPR